MTFSQNKFVVAPHDFNSEEPVCDMGDSSKLAVMSSRCQLGVLHTVEIRLSLIISPFPNPVSRRGC